jgi:hypothetical protein
MGRALRRGGATHRPLVMRAEVPEQLARFTEPPRSKGILHPEEVRNLLRRWPARASPVADTVRCPD